MIEFKPINIADIAGSFARLDPAFTHFHGKLFSFLLPSPQPFADLTKAWQPIRAAFPDQHPVFVGVGDFSQLVKFQSQLVPAMNDGRLNLQFFLSEAKLPSCTYLCLISPTEKSEHSTGYLRPVRSINFVKTLLALHFGPLCSYTWIADFDFDAQGVVSTPSPVFRMPFTGSGFGWTNFALSNEISQRLAVQLQEYRERFFRACDFVSDAINQIDSAHRFSLYWIALEIMCGTGDAIRAELAKAYGEKKKAFADDQLRFKELVQMRSELMHHGRFSPFADWQERLMQLLFWDIVIHQMNLPHRGLAKALVKSGLIEREISDRMGPSSVPPDAVSTSTASPDSASTTDGSPISQ